MGKKMRLSVWTGLLSLALALPVSAQEPTPPPPTWWPITSAIVNTMVPGLGFVMIGDQYGAYATSGLVSGFVSLAALGTPPLITIYRAPTSLFAMTAQETVFTSSYLVYQGARKLGNNLGYSHPLVEKSVPDLIFAPVQPAQFTDGRVWGAVGLIYLSNELLALLIDGPNGTVTGGILQGLRSGRTIFRARAAQLGGWTTSPAAGYGVQLGGSLLVGAHAGIGEEALFRGVLQEEGERWLGPWGGLVLGSTLFGLAHAVGGSGNPRQVLYTTVGGMIDGYLYQRSGYDLSKPIAAHTYWDGILFAISGLFPDENGNTLPLRIRYLF